MTAPRRSLRLGLIAGAVVVMLGIGVGAASALWSSAVTATSTATAAQLAVTTANFTSNAYTFGNEALTTTGSVTVTNTTSTTSTKLPSLTLTLSRASGDAALATAAGVTIWYQATGTCTTSTAVGSGAVTGTWNTPVVLTSTLAKTVAATYCVRTTIADRQAAGSATGATSFVPQIAANLAVGNFTATATATAAAGQATHYIYSLATIASNTWWMVKSSGQCMDVSGGGTSANGTAVISYACKTTDTTNQEWQFVQDGTTGYYDITPRSGITTSVRADVNGATTNGSAVTVRADSATAGQLWQPQLVAAGTYQFVNKLTGFCLTSTTTSTGAVTQAICDGSAAQKHTLTSTGSVAPAQLQNVTCSAGTLSQDATLSWTSASGGPYTVEAERTAGDWYRIAPVTGTTASGAAIDGALPTTPSSLLNWSTGDHNIRITNAGGVVGTSTITVEALWTYRYLSC
jgi:hypothetical protein